MNANLESLIVAVGGVTADVDDAKSTAGEGEHYGCRVNVLQLADPVNVTGGLSINRVWLLTQHPAHSINVVYTAVVEHTTCIRIASRNVHQFTV